MTKMLLQPIQVGTMQLRNRVVLPAMAKYLCKDGFIGEEYIQYYRNFARGGAALIVPGIMVIDPKFLASPVDQPYLNDDKYLDGLKAVCEAVHAEGAKIAFQPWVSSQRAFGPQDVPAKAREIALVNTYSKDDIKQLQEAYLQAARRAMAAGADAVEYHMAHNYFGEQFLSPYFNQRQDEYGADCVDNATRFAREVFSMLQQDIAEDINILVKQNGSDFVAGGVTPAWAADAADLLEAAGAAMITVNAGGHLTRLTGMSGDGNEEEGWKVPLAEAVKAKVKIPVAACGNICHPFFAENLLKDGKCDLVAIGRGLLAEPDWVNKLQEGREDEMRFCLSCMYCQTKSNIGAVGCTINPRAKREYLIPLEAKADGNGRSVLIIGAGPAGLEAAVTLAKRGFKPVIWEKAAQIGGTVNLALKPLGKHRLQSLIYYYQCMINKYGIELQLNKTADVDSILAQKAYAVIVATGATAVKPPIPGINSPHVLQAHDYLQQLPDLQGRRIAVLGAGNTGLEIARMLQLAGNQVTVLDMLPPKTPTAVEDKLPIAYAKQAGVDIRMEHTVQQITDDMVITDQGSFAADTVILSLGVRPDASLYNGLAAKGVKVYNIGDSDKASTIVHAVSQSYDLARLLD